VLSFPLGRILGIPIRVHASWFLILFLVTATFSREMFGEFPRAIAILAGLSGALAMFASVVLHELGHCIAARFYGIHVRRIQLFLFGGVAEIVGEPRKVLDEIVIAAAGPLVSFVLAGVLFAAVGLRWFTGDLQGSWIESDLIAKFLGIIGATNLALGVFNLIPALPTDGGRILRAMLWGLLGDYRRATSWAAGLGMVFAGGFILLGIGSVLSAWLRSSELSSALGGAWWALIGIFLARSASQAAGSARISAALRAGKVSDVMAPLRAAVGSDRTLLEVLLGAGGMSASDILLDGFPALSVEGRIIGFVEPARIHAVPRERWGSTRVLDVMTPIDALPRLQESEPLDGLLRAVAEHGNGVLVMRGEELAGYASRADLARWIFRDGGPSDDE
jgi:Zn-dependent protease